MSTPGPARERQARSELAQTVGENLRCRIDEFFLTRPHVRDFDAHLAKISGLDEAAIRRAIGTGNCTVRVLELVSIALGVLPQDLVKPSPWRRRLMRIRAQAAAARETRKHARSKKSRPRLAIVRSIAGESL